jgi:predicted MFS family arabinose efflux permease
MACTTVLNVMDRQLLAVLIDPIKRELGVSDAAMGLLTGTSFALLHIAATIPIAMWADRSVRRSIIALGLGVWSALTMLTGLARSFSEMFLIRVGVGIGEATGGGPAQSLLSDTFPPERRATALAVLIMGGPLGSMIAFAGGGWLGEVYGWRTAFVVFGAPGLLLALLIRFGVPEPRRGAFETAHPASVESRPVSFPEALGFFVRVPGLRWMVLASGLNTIGIYAVLTWAVPYMTRVHAVGTGEAGLQLAVASGLFTALGTLSCGPVADRLGARDIRWLAWLPALTSAIALPFAWGFAFAPDGASAALLLAPASFFVGTYFGPVFGAVQSLAPPQSRALAGAFLTLSNTLLGMGVAPPLVGWLSDLWTPRQGVEAIRYALAAVLIVHALAAWLLFLASLTLRRDLAAKERFLGSPS